MSRQRCLALAIGFASYWVCIAILLPECSGLPVTTLYTVITSAVHWADMRDSQFYFSRKMCLENSLALTLPESDETFQRLLDVGQGPSRETSQHAVVTLCTEMLLRIEENADDWANPESMKSSGRPLRKLLEQFFRWTRNAFRMEILKSRVMHI